MSSVFPEPLPCKTMIILNKYFGHRWKTTVFFTSESGSGTNTVCECVMTLGQAQCFFAEAGHKTPIILHTSAQKSIKQYVKYREGWL